MTKALHVNQVEKRYGKVHALKGVSMHVDVGEFVALLGPNGAGKSTLFQLLSGLFVQDAGAVTVHAINMAESPISALASLGIVFQQPTLDLDLTVRHNLEFHCQLHGMDKRLTNTAISRELDRLGLNDVSDKICRTLSGGNRRKIELARALLHQPKTLLMDEATVGLDPDSRHSLLQYVRSLCVTEGLAVLWTTHLVEEVEDADRVIVLDKGLVVAEGSPAVLVEKTGESNLLDAFLNLTHSDEKQGK